MDKQTELQNLLEDILGSRNVYFNPPNNLQMRYPAIRYEIDEFDDLNADDTAYLTNCRFKVTLIDYDPWPDTLFKIKSMAMSKFDRWYSADNLNHFVFTLYY